MTAKETKQAQQERKLNMAAPEILSSTGRPRDLTKTAGMADPAEVGEPSETAVRWQMDECPDANDDYTIRPFDGTANGNTDEPIIATVYTYGEAKLIEATPDLLEACKGLLICIGTFAGSGEYPSPDEPEIIKARAAIAKATGGAQ